VQQHSEIIQVYANLALSHTVRKLQIRCRISGGALFSRHSVYNRKSIMLKLLTKITEEN